MARSALPEGPDAGDDGTLTFELELQRPLETRLGLDVVLVRSSVSCGLVVQNVIEGGLVEEWNRQSSEPRRVRPGDFVVRANGAEGDAEAVAAELRGALGALRLAVQRAGTGETLQSWRDLRAPHAVDAEDPDCCRDPDQPEVGAEEQPVQGEADPRQSREEHGQPETGGSPVLGDSAAVAPETAPRWLCLRDKEAQSRRDPQEAHAGEAWAVGVQEAESQQSGAHTTQRPPEAGTGRQPPSGCTADVPSGGSLQALPDSPSGSVTGQFTFEVVLLKPSGTRLGIDVCPVRLLGPVGLSVKRISQDSVVADWNASCQEELAIRVGDCIISVNGIALEYKSMMEEMRYQQELRIVILRRSADFEEPPGFTGAALASVAGCRTAPALANGALPVQGGARLALPGAAGARGDASGAPLAPAVPSRSSAEGARDGVLVQEMSVPTDAAAQCPVPRSLGGSVDGGVGDGQLLRFDVELRKDTGVRLGLNVMLVTGGGISGLVVECVSEGGCVDLWNKRSQLPRRVLPNDYIVQVNGLKSWHNLARMAEEFARDCRHVTFTVQRGAHRVLQHEAVQRQLAAHHAMNARREREHGWAATSLAAARAAAEEESREASRWPHPPDSWLLATVPDALARDAPPALASRRAPIAGWPGTQHPGLGAAAGGEGLGIVARSLAGAAFAGNRGAAGTNPSSPRGQAASADLLLSMLQLADDELDRLLRAALAHRPWLRNLVAEALRTLKPPDPPLEWPAQPWPGVAAEGWGVGEPMRYQ